MQDRDPFGLPTQVHEEMELQVITVSMLLPTYLDSRTVIGLAAVALGVGMVSKQDILANQFCKTNITLNTLWMRCGGRKAPWGVEIRKADETDRKKLLHLLPAINLEILLENTGQIRRICKQSRRKSKSPRAQ